MKIRKSVLDYIYFGFFGILIIILILGQYTSYTRFTLVVIDNADPNSMYPTYYQGDLFLIYKPSNPANIKLGDVIVYKNPDDGKNIIHRVIDIEKDSNNNYYFRVKGDNLVSNWQPDSHSSGNLIPYSIVLGKIMFRIPYIGNISLAMQSDPLIRILVILFAVIVGVAIIFWPSDEEEKEKEIEYMEVTLHKILYVLSFLNPIKLFKSIKMSKHRTLILTGTGLTILFLITPLFITSFLPTPYSNSPNGITSVELSPHPYGLLGLGRTDYFIQAGVHIQDNQGTTYSIREFIMNVYVNPSNKSTLISHTVWKSLHDFKGAITVGGSILIHEQDVPPQNTTLTIVITYFVTQYWFFTSQRTFTTTFNFRIVA